jgi:predicted Zn-dependent peptidase
MKDRMVFEVTKLDNGITVYGKPMDVPFAMAEIHVPVGHMHNTGTVLPGTAHFLEHIVGNRSKRFPGMNEFLRFVGLNGGYQNAATSIRDTEYSLNVPSDVFREAFLGLVSRVFEPTLDESDLANEVSVIDNERKRKSIWYPGTDELDLHIAKKWKDLGIAGLTQIFGDTEHLKLMTSEGLREFHKNYFNPNAYLIIGGTYDHDLVCRELSRIQTRSQQPPAQIENACWKNRTYHEMKFSEGRRHLYHIGGITSDTDPLTSAGIHFTLKLLTNLTHGPLYQWLRHDRGWTYNLDTEFNCGDKFRNTDWEICLPSATAEQAGIIRSELHGRIWDAISNSDLISAELRRMMGASVFLYQTLSSVLTSAERAVYKIGRVVTEQEMIDTLHSCANADFLQKIYKDHFAPDVSGEFLALPGTA